MKISRDWLQTYFEKELPDASVLAEALTFHAFEVESVEGDVLDVKVTPNRGHDCLCHYGIAKELSAILNETFIPQKHENGVEDMLSKKTDAIVVSINNPLCKRYIAGYLKGVKIGPSPEWLRKRIEAIGQKSINNVVDATNYVMFNIGQPLHVFDAGKLKKQESYAISVRMAKKGEAMLTLDDKEYTFTDAMMVITDMHADAIIGIAGIKGGKMSGVDEGTTDIILEAANFDGVSVRRAAQALKLRTDASERFQQVLSSGLAGYGMRAAVEIIQKIAGGELVGFADEYPEPEEERSVSISVAQINQALGTSLSESDTIDVFTRLGFSYEARGREISVRAPFERLDIVIPEDLIEEVGRLVGYDKVPSTELPVFPRSPETNENFYRSEHVREDLMSDGYSEVYTSVFANSGERAVANKVGGEQSYLRKSLIPGLEETLKRNIRNKDLLGISEVRIFEIGTIWPASSNKSEHDGKEEIVVGIASEKEGTSERSLKDMAPVLSQEVGYEELPVSATERYQPFSRYPFIVRDIAMWIPGGVDENEVLGLIQREAGELLVHEALFDRFEKDGKVSLAFRLVFQSFDRTLTDEEANQHMKGIQATLESKGLEIR